MAIHHERAIDLTLQRARVHTKPQQTQPLKTQSLIGGQNGQNHQKIHNTNTRGNLMEQRRALGLCYNCGEKDFPGHQCVKKALNVINVWSENGEIQEEVGDTCEEKEFSEPVPVDAVISLHATTPSLRNNTMKMSGTIANKPVVTLIDSGSTHSFLYPRI